MEKQKNYIDLHIHTNKSDGLFNPVEIIQIANKNDTSIISICDHDSINALNDVKINLLNNMTGINGVEFSSYIDLNGKKIKLHILGYGFQEDSTYILKLLEEMKTKRMIAHLKLLNVVKEKTKEIPESKIAQLDMEKYCWFDREILKCFKDENYSKDVLEQLTSYFNLNRFSYGNDYELNAKDVIDAIKLSGGYVVLAHPMAYRLSREYIFEIIIKLIKMGIDGIEIFQSDCSIEDSLFLKNIVEKYNLLYSVGSDFHRLINSDGRIIGHGINDNLCIEETSLTNKILEKKKYFKGMR